jgi:hypothetical protein
LEVGSELRDSERSFINDAFGFAFGHRQSAGRKDIYFGFNPDFGFEFLDQLILEGRHVLDLAVKTGGG